MNYELSIGNIVDRLQPFTEAKITVRRMPEKESENTDIEGDAARFTVIYAGSEYEEAQSTGHISQEENIFFQIMVESGFLYGPRGVYNLADVLRKSLIGFKPAGFLYPGLQVSKHFTIGSPEAVKVNNMWRYQVIFKGKTLAVENFAEDLTPLLKKITLNDGAEQIVIPPVNP